MSDLEFLHWFTTAYFAASMIATALVQIIPPPEEIANPTYVIIFRTLQRLSVHRRPWPENGNTPK